MVNNLLNFISVCKLGFFSDPLSSLMFVRLLDGNKEQFQPQEKNDEIVGFELSYLSAFCALMCLAITTVHDIAVHVNLLAMYILLLLLEDIGNRIKCILGCYKGTTDMGLFHSHSCSPNLVGYADRGYLSDPNKARSLIGYVFIYEELTYLLDL